MKKKLFPILTLTIIIFFGACSNEEILQDQNSGTKPGSERTLSLTASMPTEPTTRVGLEQKADKTIALTWEMDDELQLAFVQGDNKAKSIAKVMSISPDKKKASFDIKIPDGFDTGVFDLYGVYGGGGLSDANPTQAQLPTNAGNTTSLGGDEASSVQNRKDVMLYFESKGIEVNKPQASVMFQHLGSLFSFTLQNNGSSAMDDIKEVRLSSDDTTNKWGYNTGAGNQIYDFIDGFQNKVEGSDYYIYFGAESKSFEAGQPVTLWAWYPPLPEVSWPALKIELVKTDNSIIASANALPARTNPTTAAKSYYFYAAWDGAELNFTNDVFTNELTIDVAEMGTLVTLLSPTQKSIVKKLTVTGQINKADYDVMKQDMPSLTYVDLSQVTSYEGSTLNKIPDSAFGSFDMTSEENPFEDANQIIQTVILPQSATVIGANAFSGCMGITSTLIIPDNVTTIGDMAFAASGFTGTLTIPNKVATIEGMAFTGSNLNGLIFQDGSNLTSIGEGAFMQCVNLTGKLNLPASLVEIGDGAFSDCRFSGSLSIPDKVTKIGDSAFYGSKFTGPLIIPKEVIAIGDHAFQFCGFTGSLSFQDGSKLEAIGRLSFYDCGFTGPLVPPSNLQTIGDKAFQSCEGFTGNIVFPSTLTSIGESSFISCDLVDAFQFMSVTPAEYGDIMLPEYKTVYVPAGTVETYETKWGTNAIRHTLVGVIDVPAMGSLSTLLSESGASLANISSLRVTGEVNLADFVVMKSMSNLTYLDLKDVTCEANKIPDSAFGYSNITGAANTKIETIIFPESITSIGSRAFQSCTGLSGSLTIPDKVTSIGSSAFQGCTGFKENLSLPGELNTIGTYAFVDCAGFTGSLVIPNNVTTIGNYAFNNCKGFTDLTLSDKLTTIGSNAFSDCDKIAGTVVFPATLTSVGSKGFYASYKITTFQFLGETVVPYTNQMLVSERSKTIQVPSAVLDAYKAALGWSTYPGTIVGY